jgi:hypothetical protein
MAMAHAALGDNVIGKMLNVAHIAFQHGDFQAVVMVDMYMQRGDGEIVMMMLWPLNGSNRASHVHKHRRVPRSPVPCS